MEWLESAINAVGQIGSAALNNATAKKYSSMNTSVLTQPNPGGFIGGITDVLNNGVKIRTDNSIDQKSILMLVGGLLLVVLFLKKK